MNELQEKGVACLDESRIKQLCVVANNFGRKNALHMVYDAKEKGAYYDLMGYQHDDKPEVKYVLLLWVPERAGHPEGDVYCDLAEYFPDFDSGVRRLIELENEDDEA